MSRSAPSPDDGHAHEMELAVDEACPFAALSDRLDCRLDVLEAITPYDEAGKISAFVRLHGTDVGPLEAAIADSEALTDLRVLDSFEHEIICELTIDGTCIIRTLGFARSLFHSGTAEDGQGRFIAILPPDRDPDEVVARLQEHHPSLSVLALRERPVAAPLLTRHGFQTLLEDRLTERQWTALELAHEGGYFDRPSQTSQGHLAEAMGISQETVSQHLRAAQRRLLEFVFDEGLVRTGDGAGD